MFSRIINLVSIKITIVLFLSFRKVPDQTFSKKEKKIAILYKSNIIIVHFKK